MESGKIGFLFIPIYHHSQLFPLVYHKQCVLTQIGFAINRFPQQFKSGEHILDKAYTDSHDFACLPSNVHQSTLMDICGTSHISTHGSHSNHAAEDERGVITQLLVLLVLLFIVLSIIH